MSYFNVGCDTQFGRFFRLKLGGRLLNRQDLDQHRGRLRCLWEQKWEGHSTSGEAGVMSRSLREREKLYKVAK